MAVPDFQTLMLPLLKLASDGQQHALSEAVEQMAKEFQLSREDQAELLPSGQPRLYNRIGWATTYLKKAGLLQSVAPGRFKLTDRGRDVLASQPTTINVAFLESKFPEMLAFRKARSKVEVADEEPSFNTADGTWNQRASVEERIRTMMELSIPNEALRRAAVGLLASAIEAADEEGSNAWRVSETERGLRVMTGRLLACEVGRSQMRVSVIGPIDDDVRGALGAETENDEEFRFKIIPGGLLLTFPVEHAPEALNLLRDGLNSFVDAAVARVRSSVSLEDHVPEAVVYIASAVGRELPQPKPALASNDEQLDDDTEEDETGVSREPRVRGRAPIFEHGQRSIASLMADIEREVIALPDLQRPFVWEDTKVRDLLNLLFVGFPVGTLVFWHTSSDKEARALGARNDRASEPRHWSSTANSVSRRSTR